MSLTPTIDDLMSDFSACQGETTPVRFSDIWLSRKARICIAMGANKLSASTGKSPQTLRKSMIRDFFWHRDSGELGLNMAAPGCSENGHYVRIPEDQWGFRQGHDHRQ